MVQAVYERLSLWSGLGYVGPFVWAVPGETPTFVRVENGEQTETDLGRALEALEMPGVVGIGLADETGDIDGELYTAVKRIARLVGHAVPAVRLPDPRLIFFPANEVVKIARPDDGDLVNSLTVVVPEDMSDPASTNFLVAPDEGVFASHVAHAIACLAGIWGTATDPPLEESTDDGAASAKLARCHSRVIDAGYLADHLASYAFTISSDGWPNPDSTKFERAKLEDTVLADAAESFIGAHRSVLLRTEPPVPEEEPPLTLWAGIKRVFWYVLRRLVSWPIAAFYRAVCWFWNTKLAPFIERLAPGSGVRIVRLGKKASAEVLAPLAAPKILDGPVGPAWHDLATLVAGLIDGGVLPEWFDEDQITVGALRIIEEQPEHLVLDPEEPTPLSSRIDVRFRFNPREVDAAVETELCRSMAIASKLTEQLGALAAQILQAGASAAAEGQTSQPQTADADPATTAASDLKELFAQIESLVAGLQAISEQVKAVLAWRRHIRSTLLHRIAERLQLEIDEIAVEATPPTEDERQEADRLDEEAKKTRPRRWRRFGAYSLAFAVLGAWGIVGPHIPGSDRPLMVGGAVGGWWIVALRSWWRRHISHTPEQKRAAEFREAFERREVNASWRANDLLRLQRRFEEFLEWGDLISRFIHRPWVARPVKYEAPRVQTLKDAKLPQAARVAYASLTESDVARLAGAARASVFQEGWLGFHLQEWLERATNEWRRQRPSRGARQGANPDAFGDTSRDADSIRPFVIGLARQGALRRIDESEAFEEFITEVGQYPLTDTVPAVTDSTDTEELPLAPLPDWFEAPVGLQEASERVKSTVVGIAITKGNTAMGTASGVIVSPLGVVATNRHVVDDADRLDVVLIDGTRLPARVEVTSEYGDLALIRFEPSGPLRAAPPTGRADLVQGTPVFTLGYPFFSTETGEPALSWGIVAARRRKLDADSGMYPGNYVQLNYPAGPGGSGSPVFNLDGELVAIHAGGLADASAHPRGRYLSFAMPAEDLRPMLEIVEPDELARVALVEQPAGSRQRELGSYTQPLAKPPSPCLFGPYGDLTATARRVADPSLRPDGLKRLGDGVSISDLKVSDFFATLRIGEPTRAALSRIDRSQKFVLDIVEAGETLPWFTREEHSPAAEPPAPEPSETGHLGRL